MFFKNKTKLNFGSIEEDPGLFTRKIQAISNLAAGSFDLNLFDDPEQAEVCIWRFSDYFDRKHVAGHRNPHISKTNLVKGKTKEEKQAILDQIALKYNIDDDINEDFETSSDIHLFPDEDFNLLDDENINLNKEQNYFGRKAKNKFWQLYKSDRTFKDNINNDVKDPRFAYIKSCQEMRMLPKAGLVIRGEQTKHLSFANQGLLQKNTKAVCELLKRYPLEIEALDFTGNGIKMAECIILVDSIDSHCATLLHINFSHNKIGYEGALKLCEKLKKMKNLESLNLNGNLLGDIACGQIIKVLNGLLNLKTLNLSNNALGNKGHDSQLVEQMWVMMKITGSLINLDLSWNNFRGEGASIILLSLKENYTIKYLNLSYNLFGVSGK